MVAEMESITLAAPTPPIYVLLPPYLFPFIPLIFIIWGTILLVRLKNQVSKLLKVAVILSLISTIFFQLVYVAILLAARLSPSPGPPGHISGHIDIGYYGYSIIFISLLLICVTSLVLSIISLIKNERTSLHWGVFTYSLLILLTSPGHIVWISFYLLGGPG